MWVMPSAQSAKCNADWLHRQGIETPELCIYIAPEYRGQVEDLALVELVRDLRPRHVIVAVGGGTQERLGLYLKRHLVDCPSIHCIGAAIGFLSGDQVRIPTWADYFLMGWLFRCLSRPRVFIPRYWNARKLFGLLFRYRSNMPTLGAWQELSNISV